MVQVWSCPWFLFMGWLHSLLPAELSWLRVSLKRWLLAAPLCTCHLKKDWSFVFVLNSHPWKGGLAELGLGGYLEPREWHEVAGTWLLPLKLCVIAVEGQFLEMDEYFLSPLTFPGPLSPEVFDLETLYTPISFVQVFPHLSAGLPRPSR